MTDCFFIHIDPLHQKLFKSMERVEKAIERKGLTEYKDKQGMWQQENPTLRAIRQGKPLDYYWDKRFKGWQNWPSRPMTDTEVRQQIIREAKEEAKEKTEDV